MTGFAVLRVLVLGLVWAMSIVVLGIAANTLALSVGNVWLFPNLALAVSIITHAVATPVLVISFAKKGAYTSMVVVELSWVGVLWMIWLAAAVVTTSTPVFPSSCMEYRTNFGGEVAAECTQFVWLQATSWFITALLLLYSITLFTLALVTNMWRREEPAYDETRVDFDALPNAFFTDASALKFFCAPVMKTEQETPGVSLKRADTKVAPLYEGAHPYWTNYNQSDTSFADGSTLERGRSTSTVSSITKSYLPTYQPTIPSPLGRPQKAVLPSQNPYLNTKKATTTTMLFSFPKRQSAGGI